MVDFSQFEYATGSADWQPSEVGQGWWPLLHGMMTDIERVAGSNWRLEKVREKMGALDIDVVGRNDLGMERFVQVGEIVDRVEIASETICEFCGKAGQIECWNSLRYRCLCPEHGEAARPAGHR